MSDYNSSLPVRSESDVDELLRTRLVDGANPSLLAEIKEDNSDGILKLRVKSHLNDHAGNPYSESNPLAIFIAEDPADEINDFDTEIDLVKNNSAQHNYTVSVGKKFKGLVVCGSASGKAKFELQIEDGPNSGVFTTEAVAFNSTACPNVEMSYKKIIDAELVIRVVKTNLDNQPQDVYTQIKGLEA